MAHSLIYGPAEVSGVDHPVSLHPLSAGLKTWRLLLKSSGRRGPFFQQVPFSGAILIICSKTPDEQRSSTDGVRTLQVSPEGNVPTFLGMLHRNYKSDCAIDL